MAKSSSKARSSRRRSEQNSNQIGLWIIGISAAVVLFVVVAVALGSRQPSIAVSAPDVQEEWINRSTLGDPNAPVTVQAWEDFLCPACRQWTAQIEPQLVDDYVKTGLVKLEFRQFPLQSHEPGSQMAALASECAADQGAFWSYHDRLFQAQDDGQAGYSLDRLVQYADEQSLDSRLFLQCMSGQEHRNAISDSLNQAVALGLNATPSVLVNGKLIENPFDYAALSAEIDALLPESEGGQ